MALDYRIDLGGEIQSSEAPNWLSSAPDFKRDGDELTAPDLGIFISQPYGSLNRNNRGRVLVFTINWNFIPCQQIR